MDKLRTVFEIKNKKAGPVSDEDDVKEAQASKEKVSKWRGNSLKSIRCDSWWFLLRLCAPVQELLDHIFHFLEKHSSMLELIRESTMCS